MTDRKAPLDLVGRAAARINLDGLETGPNQDAAPAVALPPASLPQPVAPTPSPIQPPAQPPAAAPLAGSPAPGTEPTTQPAQTSGTQVGGVLNLDFVSLQKDGMLTPQTQGSRLTEEFRLIKRPLLRISAESRLSGTGNGHVIMVTSSHPNDGKTFVSSNLALSMAFEQDLFVLAIDADIRRRGLTKRFGAENRPGIMDVLLDNTISISDVMVRTSISNLAIIPAGKEVEGATELFASHRMAKLVADIASRYKDRVIIFDTPPVLAASEAGVLASLVGQVAFVVNSGETSKRSINEALRLIRVCPNVHFVINRTMRATTDDSFGYYGY